MNVKEAADYLSERGYPCAPSTVRTLARGKRLMCYRPGPTRRGRMSFTGGMLDAFLAAEIIGVSRAEPEKKAPVQGDGAPRKPRTSSLRVAASDDWRADYEKIKGA